MNSLIILLLICFLSPVLLYYFSNRQKSKNDPCVKNVHPEGSETVLWENRREIWKKDCKSLLDSLIVIAIIFAANYYFSSNWTNLTLNRLLFVLGFIVVCFIVIFARTIIIYAHKAKYGFSRIELRAPPVIGQHCSGKIVFPHDFSSQDISMKLVAGERRGLKKIKDGECIFQTDLKGEFINGETVVDIDFTIPERKEKTHETIEKENKSWFIFVGIDDGKITFTYKIPFIRKPGGRLTGAT